MARKERFDIPGRGPTDGYTLNHTSPGPRIVAQQGDLVQVTLHNENIADGMTLHWHGVDVPNAEDGVAGVTQNAVQPGQPYVTAQDVVAAVHTYGKIRTVNGEYGERRVPAPGPTARVRLVNTDNGPMAVWVDGAPYKVLAVDGTDANAPTTLVIGNGDAPAGPAPADRVDLLGHGSPKPLGFDPAKADRLLRYDIGRHFGFFDGKPGREGLPHATQGLVTHLMYTGVTTKYHLGGPSANQPE
ncbi:multicopper oxidase domain-containing protein [Kribbella sp. NPDC059898]|uniref:multicopper oxidase domain-containing protein n=1 Tax=Kribbella sp. NPDC059898 TaxID=3346995 RepID=UPI003661CC4C